MNPGDLKWDKLGECGELVVYDDLPKSEDETVKRIGESEIVITNKTPITKTILERCPNISFIALLSTGYDVVDVSVARKRGIGVANVPTYGTDSVAQYAIALLLELCHHIGHHSSQVHGGRWTECGEWSFWDYPLVELYGKTMGIIGLGRIGRRTGEIARALGMNVIYHSHHQEDKEFQYTDLDTLLSSSDVISLHCPLTSETRGIINTSTIARMKDGVLIINTARGGLVDEKALRNGLESGKIGGAAVDVVSKEPIESGNPLLGARNCIITPHMAWGAREARERIISITADNVSKFLSGKPQNIVN